jgi:cellulose biosynthesis protein BcsQ
MKLISIFNNKGGVGKTTLTFHIAHALAEMGHKTLLIDLDPQCNLTIQALPEEIIHSIWEREDDFIDDFKSARSKATTAEFSALISSTRTIHFLLKPTEDGVTDVEFLSPPAVLAANLDLIPGRLSMHLFEDKLSRRWSDVYQGDPLAIRTATRVREVARQYADAHEYDYVIVDTSPSLGMLNKVIISTADGFLIPCMPDLFSLYGIRNIGQALGIWKREFDTIYQLLSEGKRASFPPHFVRLLGFTIYNARKYSGERNPWDLAAGHYNYACQIPEAITRFIPKSIRAGLSAEVMSKPIGETSVMHSHNTLPSMGQKYHLPIWRLPGSDALESEDAMTIRGNRQNYEATRGGYHAFVSDMLSRMESLE